MRRASLIAALLIASLIIVGLFSSCRDDVLVDPPASLIGNYSGIYTIAVRNGLDTLDFRNQFVSFKFSSSTYQLRWDQGPDAAPSDDSASSNIRYFCDSDGEYTLESGAQFIVTNPNVNPAVCTEGNNPDGFFSLNQSSDTIRIIQVFTNTDGNSETRTLRLIKSGS